MKKRSILEVWDYRLSHAQPINYRGQIPVQNEDGEWGLDDHPNWIAVIYSQDDDPTPLEIHDTGIPLEAGDLHDGPGLDACYKFYRSVRDKYSRENIEELKPLVANIRKADAIRQKATDAYQAVLTEAKANGEL